MSFTSLIYATHTIVMGRVMNTDISFRYTVHSTSGDWAGAMCKEAAVLAKPIDRDKWVTIIAPW